MAGPDFPIFFLKVKADRSTPEYRKFGNPSLYLHSGAACRCPTARTRKDGDFAAAVVDVVQLEGHEWKAPAAGHHAIHADRLRRVSSRFFLHFGNLDPAGCAARENEDADERNRK
jgi:hypothetical protein